MTRRTAFAIGAILISFSTAFGALGFRPAGAAEPTRSEAPNASRPAKWAAPLTAAGVTNLHKVNDGLYRSAQPTEEGFKNLKALGIKTVVNLRAVHSDRDEITPLGLGYEHIKMKSWHAEEADVIRFLRIVSDPKQTPVLVHCQHGSDRTGTMCAIYRIAVQGWSKEEAIKEMTEGGYGFHETWQNLLAFVNHLDVARIRREAGITK
jgi:protein tyrosine phosphatase (PTP) superfamily phosphohydrolase (DUF442 family)